MLSIIFALGSLMATTQDQQKLPDVEMGKAQLVFLVDDPGAPRLTDKAQSTLQAQHLKNLEKLWISRRALALGPLEDAGEKRGIVVLDVATPEAAQKMMASDPFVKAHVLKLECHTWFFGKNYLQKGPKFMDLEDVWFGMLERPEGLPAVTKEEAESLQAGHMANITKMAEQRKLLIAGPMEEITPFRGVFVFKNMEEGKVRELTAPDPLVKSGRLKLSLFKWHVAKGTFLLGQ